MALVKPPLTLTNALFTEQVVLSQPRVNNIMDLCFTNNTNIVHDVNVTPTLVK